jgi:hypothetical protein
MDGGPESAIVRVRSPGLISRPAAARQLIREIDAGLVVEMKPPILPSS